MTQRDGHVTGWEQLLALACLVAALCLLFDMGRVVPVWSILIALWGMLRIGRRKVFRFRTPWSWHSHPLSAEH